MKVQGEGREWGQREDGWTKRGMISNRMAFRGGCMTVLHGCVCHRTSASHNKSKNKTKRRKKNNHIRLDVEAAKRWMNII